MQAEQVAVVTGAASGIGAALARQLAGRGAAVVVADIDAEGAERVAGEIVAAGHRAVAAVANVAVEAETAGLVATAESMFGPVDVFCANAGIAVGAGPETPDEVWNRAWGVNVAAHIYAARALLPGWLARGSGAFVVTASAAGLLTQLGSAPYAVTKHAAVAFAEWLAVTYGDAGIRVVCLCPQGVDTPLLRSALGSTAGAAVRLAGDILDADTVARYALDGLDAGRFLVLPHPEVRRYATARAEDHDGWIAAMRGFQASLAQEDQP